MSAQDKQAYIRVNCALARACLIAAGQELKRAQGYIVTAEVTEEVTAEEKRCLDRSTKAAYDEMARASFMLRQG